MAPLEPWEKVLITEAYLNDPHSGTSCISCHGGQQAGDKLTAHTGLVRNPTEDAEKFCGSCHEEIVGQYATSLHNTLNGYDVATFSRSVPENHPALEEAMNNHCSSCHTTCADCHISQPNSVGGGFLDGHAYIKTPPMTRTCTACHGSRVGNEYLGKNGEEIPGDVHFRTARMNCVSCHSGENIHATPEDGVFNRYAGAEEPSCQTCHTDVGAAGDPITQHTIHGEKVQCQVCHSIEYTSCDGCHVAVSEETGNPFFKSDAHYLGFYIGKNPRQDENRPYEYAVLRHVPIDPANYDYYGENLLPNFDLVNTWMYSTPHNIQRKTPQNQSCNACHGNSDLFLTADKVKPEELTANQGVIVDQVPSQVGGN